MATILKKKPASRGVTSDVLTLKEAATYLRLTASELGKLAKHGEIPGRSVGNEWRFLKAALDRWLQGEKYPSVLLDELESSLRDRLNGTLKTEAKPGSKKGILEFAGMWKGDPVIEEFLAELDRSRGLPPLEVE